MPTRILDLSGALESDFVLRASEDEYGEYACLSYKWGNTNRLEVSFPSLARPMFNSAMSPQDKRLPLTFRDAIKVARSIGLSYLWIDALCIWQDDDNDKRLELERMNKYYANCTLVIQASGTESVSEGFLDLSYQSKNRSVFESYLEPLPFKSSDGREDTIYVCLGEEVDWYRKNDQPAAKRGWIFQEEILCRRILIFPAGGGMIFRCDSHEMETNDGNVFYDPDVHEAPRYWTKDRLLEREEDLRPPLIPLSGRCNTLLESVLSFSEVPGLNPSLLLKGRNALIDYGSPEDTDSARSPEYPYESLEDSDGSSDDSDADESLEESYESPEHSNSDGSPEHSDGPSEDSDSDRSLEYFYESPEDSGSDRSPGNSASDGSSEHSYGPSEDYDGSLEDSDSDGSPEYSYESPDDSDGSSDGIRLVPVKVKSAEEAAYAKTTAVLRRAGYPDTLVHTRTPPGVALPGEIHDTWKHLVADYCARDLTKSSDKLIAIDALAREFQERYGRALGSYHAGLWSDFAPAGLIWRSTRPVPPNAEFRVPSWSWAAVRTASYPDEGVHNGLLELGADFKDVDVQLSSFISTEESGDEVEQIRLVTKLLDVWWGLDTIPQHKVRKRLPRSIIAYWKKITKWLVKRTRHHKLSNRSRSCLKPCLRAKSRVGKAGKLSKEKTSSPHTGKNLPVRTSQAVMSQQEGLSYAVFQEDGEVLTKKVYPDHSVDLPRYGRQSVAMMLGRRYVTGVGHDQHQHGEVLLLRKRENGTYVRIAFAELLFKDFEEVWEPSFKVETIVLA